MSYGVHDAAFGDRFGSIAHADLQNQEVILIDSTSENQGFNFFIELDMEPQEYFEELAEAFPRSKDPSLNFNMNLFHTFNFRGAKELPLKVGFCVSLSILWLGLSLVRFER